MSSARYRQHQPRCWRDVQDDGRCRPGPPFTYRRGSQVVPDLLGGQVQVTFNPLPYVPRFHKVWKVARSCSDQHRPARMRCRTFPPLGEFFPGYEAAAGSLRKSAVPKNTSAEVVENLNKAINAGLDDPQLKAHLILLSEACTAPNVCRPRIWLPSSPQRPRSGPRSLKS